MATGIVAELHDWRCSGCRHRIARISISIGIVEIVCRSCKTLNVSTAMIVST